MFKSIHPAVEAALIFMVLAFATAITDVSAQDVTYCKHGQTGKIITIESNYACPFGYYKI